MRLRSTLPRLLLSSLMLSSKKNETVFFRRNNLEAIGRKLICKVDLDARQWDADRQRRRWPSSGGGYFPEPEGRADAGLDEPVGPRARGGVALLARVSGRTLPR